MLNVGGSRGFQGDQALSVQRKPIYVSRISIVTAESCTSGLLAWLLSEAPGAAQWLHGGFVTYTKQNKTTALGVQS